MGRGTYGGVTWSNLQPTTFGAYSLLNSMSRCVFVIGLLYMFVAIGMFKDVFGDILNWVCCFVNHDKGGCLNADRMICILFRIILGIGYFFIGFLLYKNAGDGNGKCTCGMVHCAPKVFLLVMAVLQILNFLIWLFYEIICFLKSEKLGDFKELLACFSIFGVGLDMKGIYICVIVFCYGNESGSPMFGGGGGKPVGAGSKGGFGGGSEKSKTGTNASGTRGANSVQPIDEESQAKDKDEEKPNDPMMSENTDENRSAGGGTGSLKQKSSHDKHDKHKKRKSKVK